MERGGGGGRGLGQNENGNNRGRKGGTVHLQPYKTCLFMLERTNLGLIADHRQATEDGMNTGPVLPSSRLTVLLKAIFATREFVSLNG